MNTQQILLELMKKYTLEELARITKISIKRLGLYLKGELRPRDEVRTRIEYIYKNTFDSVFNIEELELLQRALTVSYCHLGDCEDKLIEDINKVYNKVLFLKNI